MSKKTTTREAPATAQGAPNGAENAAGAPAAAAPAAGKVALQHPLLDEARALVARGDARAAADRLATLAAQRKAPGERVQALALAAQFLKAVDPARALQLATEASEAAPDAPQGWQALAAVHDQARRGRDAVAAALRALGTPLTPRERVDLGRLLARHGQEAKGLEAVRRGYEESGRDLALASYALRVALQCADWELSQRLTAQLAQAHAEGRTAAALETPRTHVLWCGDEATNIQVIRAFAERTFPAREPLVKAPWPHDGQRKLRIGYLSSDYRDHATSLLALGLMRHHNRHRFELYGYCTSYDDGSALRREMLNRFDKARSLARLGDRQAAEVIARDRIDVLVDLNGLTEGTRHGVLAWRPAPVQISYLGYPGTVGGRFVDYIVGDDETVPPGAEQLYPEKVIRVPPTYQINDYLARYLPPAPPRERTGLPPGVPVIGMFNNVNKVHPAVWSTWMDILKRVPKAVLWMLQPGPQAVEHLNAAAQAAGVAPQRLVFAPKMRQEQHMARLRHCDLVLDPWPYGGHTTTADALFAGVPVVALAGTNFASRVSGGLLRAAGLSQLVLPDVQAYADKAVALLEQPAQLLAMKRALLQARSRLPVFDAPGRTRQLEAAYLTAYGRALKGEPPQHLRVAVQREAPPRAAAPTTDEAVAAAAA